MKNPCHKVGVDLLRHCSSTAFQSRSFHRKIFQHFFLILIIIYFLRTPFGPHEWACGLWISLFGILVFLISQPCLYIFPTSKAIYKLKLQHKLTTEHTLHSRVKSSITQNQDCCFS